MQKLPSATGKKIEGRKVVSSESLSISGQRHVWQQPVAPFRYQARRSIARREFDKDTLTSIDRESPIKSFAHEPLPMNVLQMLQHNLRQRVGVDAVEWHVLLPFHIRGRRRKFSRACGDHWPRCGATFLAKNDRGNVSMVRDQRTACA